MAEMKDGFRSNALEGDPGFAPVRIAVVGVGHLGKIHARLLKGLREAELVGVVDQDLDRARELGEELGVAFSGEPLSLPSDWGLEAVSLVVPTAFHCELGCFYLEKGLHVLIEKPMAKTVEEGTLLCKLAREHGRLLQIGHVERFNPAVKSIHDLGIRARYLEAERLAPFSFRSTDIGVVLDLMIHDLDLILSFVESPLVDVEAFGGAIFTSAEDLAVARLKFEDGTIARLTANRVALKPSRRMRFFSKESYVSLDFEKKYGLIIKKAPGWDLHKLNLGDIDTSRIENLWKYVFEGLLQVQELDMPEENPLQEELRSFLVSVRTQKNPLVDGEAGLRALKAAQMVLESIQSHRW
jgi:predicted dehydrogenase